VAPGDFHPGSIVRVAVENFVTYEKAEFLPGPNLNMIIGPNGTGKSSLVCAICLGLGYGPKHLGRAGSVKEFVKHGKDVATIEIELRKRPQDRHNFVVRVQIRREQNSQKWWLNGKETSHKNIQGLMKKLKIQVDNLCQFLPQDRVVEFAACTPVDLLHETLRAAAPEEMIDWQEQLQGLHKDKKELNGAVRTDADSLSNLESRQQGLQADVDRVREREEIETNVKNLKAARVLAQYNEARVRYGEARARQREAEQSLKNFENESGPSLEAVNRKQEYARQVAAMIPTRRRAVSDAERKSTALGRRVAEVSDSVKNFDARLEGERKSFDAKKKELAASRQRLTQLQADQKNQPPVFDATEWNRRIVGGTTNYLSKISVTDGLSSREPKSTSSESWTRKRDRSRPR
jgi:structural maintenance of chromosomes protein 5